MFEKNDADLEPLEGPVSFAHQFVDMPNYSVEIQDPVDGPKMVRNSSQTSHKCSRDNNFFKCS